MAQLVVRNLENEVKSRLKRRARRHGRSMEEEVREILRNAAKEDGTEPGGLGTRIAARFKKYGFKKGEIQELRGFQPQLPDFGE